MPVSDMMAQVATKTFDVIECNIFDSSFVVLHCFASFCVVKRLIRKRDFADPSFRQIVFVHVHRLRDTRYTCRESDLILKIKSSHSKAQHFQMTVYVSLYYHQSDFLCEFFSSSIFISWYSTINRSNFLLHATTRLSSKP